MDDNEWAFCSLWSESAKVDGCANVLVNSRLRGDYFFNRARLTGCKNPRATIESIAKIFWQNDLDCYLHDIDGNLPKDIEQIDTMCVFKADGSKAKISSSKVIRVDRQLLPVWIDVFCRAFAVPEWKTEVERIFHANLQKMELILSYRDGEPVGCAALFTQSDVTGLYCLGIVSKLRRKGLAAEILRSAIAMKKELFLQTLGSEGLVGLYEKAGFRLAYTKKIFVIPKPVA